MEYVEFGCNKTKVSKVVLGCMRIQQLGTQGGMLSFRYSARLWYQLY